MKKFAMPRLVPVGTGLFVMACFCLRSFQSKSAVANKSSPFEIGTLSNGFVVSFAKAQYWWTIETNMVSINVGAYQSVTLFLNPTNDRIERIVTELKSTNGSNSLLKNAICLKPFGGSGV